MRYRNRPQRIEQVAMFKPAKYSKKTLARISYTARLAAVSFRMYSRLR